MTDDALDKISKTSFPDADTAFEAKYWNQMEGMLGKKKKRGFIFWWGIGALVLLLSATFAWNNIVDDYIFDVAGFLNQENLIAETTGNEITINENIKVDPTINSDENKLEENSNSNKIIDLKDQNVSSDRLENTITSNSALISKTKLDDKKENPTYELIGTTSDIGKSIEDNKNNVNNHSSNEPVIAIAVMANSNAEDNPIQNQPRINEADIQVEPHRESANEPLELVEKQASSTDSDDGDSVGNKESEEKYNESEQEVDGVLEEENTNSPKQSNLITDSGLNPENTLDGELENEEDEVETEFGEDVPAGKKWKFFVEPLFGYSQSQLTTSLLSESINSTSIVSPSSIKDWNVGIDVGMQYGNFFVKTGIRFQEVKQNFNVKNTTSEISDEYQYKERNVGERIDVVGSEHFVVKVPDGNNGFNFQGYNSLKYDTVLLTVTDTVLIQNKVDQESRNSFKYKIQYIAVPLIVGYEYQFKEKWLIETSGGILTGIRIKQTGGTFDYSNNEVIKLKETSFASNYTFAISVGVGVGYLFNPALSLRLRPTYKYLIKTPFVLPKRQKHTVGIEVGLRIKF